MNQNERKTVARRMILLIAVACVIMGLYVMRLIFLQLVNGDSFKAKATNTTDYKFTVTAARGNIVDSTGTALVVLSLDWLFFYYMPGYAGAALRYIAFVLPSAVLTLPAALLAFWLVQRIHDGFRIDNGVV